MKDTDRQRIERRLEEFAAWRASGMALKAYVQLRGEELAHWRARLSWERRWRQMLNGPNTQDTPAHSAFVRATPSQASTTAKPQTQPAPHPAQQQTSFRIVINAKGGALQASVGWPGWRYRQLRLAARGAVMMRIDAWFLATAPLDMRCGMDRLLARVVGVFGVAQPHTAYAFANLRASRMKILICTVCSHCLTRRW